MTDIHPFETEAAHAVVNHKYMAPHGETHWYQTADRAVHYPMEALKPYGAGSFDREAGELRWLVRDRHFMPGGRYLYASGNDYHQTQNCLLLDVDDTREDWSALAWKEMQSLLTGAGVGTYYGKVRANGYKVGRTGGIASGPLPLMLAGNELGRAAVQGGDRRSARWNGLPWWHPDIFDFIAAKNWPQYIKDAKQAALEPGYDGPPVKADLDMTNISVCLDDWFFAAFDDTTEPGLRYAMRNDHNIPEWLNVDHAPDDSTWHSWATRVYWTAIDQMTQTGEPGFSIDTGEHRDEKLRNACTEIVSADDGDICNLGGLSLARFEDDLPRFERACRLAALYLTAGTLYSHVPYYQDDCPAGVTGVDVVREKNRRLGLDLMGVSELLIRKGVRYGSDDAFEVLDPYMAVYSRTLEFAWDWQDKLGISRSVAATSGAPTGTRGFGAETTTGWQIVTAVASGRWVITSKANATDKRTYHYIIDPSIARAIKDGKITADEYVEDSYDLATDHKRLFAQQAYAQRYTDQAISMTLNLPHVMTDPAERRVFGEDLYKRLPELRGITVYPDGAIAGQPIQRVKLSEAVAAAPELVEVEGAVDDCVAGVCAL